MRFPNVTSFVVNVVTSTILSRTLLNTNCRCSLHLDLVARRMSKVAISDDLLALAAGIIWSLTFSYSGFKGWSTRTPNAQRSEANRSDAVPTAEGVESAVFGEIYRRRVPASSELGESRLPPAAGLKALLSGVTTGLAEPNASEALVPDSFDVYDLNSHHVPARSDVVLGLKDFAAVYSAGNHAFRADRASGVSGTGIDVGGAASPTQEQPAAVSPSEEQLGARDLTLFVLITNLIFNNSVVAGQDQAEDCDKGVLLEVDAEGQRPPAVAESEAESAPSGSGGQPRGSDAGVSTGLGSFSEVAAVAAASTTVTAAIAQRSGGGAVAAACPPAVQGFDRFRVHCNVSFLTEDEGEAACGGRDGVGAIRSPAVCEGVYTFRSLVLAAPAPGPSALIDGGSNGQAGDSSGGNGSQGGFSSHSDCSGGDNSSSDWSSGENGAGEGGRGRHCSARNGEGIGSGGSGDDGDKCCDRNDEISGRDGSSGCTSSGGAVYFYDTRLTGIDPCTPADVPCRSFPHVRELGSRLLELETCFAQPRQQQEEEGKHGKGSSLAGPTAPVATACSPAAPFGFGRCCSEGGWNGLSPAAGSVRGQLHERERALPALPSPAPATPGLHHPQLHLPSPCGKEEHPLTQDAAAMGDLAVADPGPAPTPGASLKPNLRPGVRPRPDATPPTTRPSRSRQFPYSPDLAAFHSLPTLTSPQRHPAAASAPPAARLFPGHLLEDAAAEPSPTSSVTCAEEQGETPPIARRLPASRTVSTSTTTTASTSSTSRRSTLNGLRQHSHQPARQPYLSLHQRQYAVLGAKTGSAAVSPAVAASASLQLSRRRQAREQAQAAMCVAATCPGYLRPTVASTAKTVPSQQPNPAAVPASY